MSLFVDDANLRLAALSLDRLATINDAMVARCGCDARTNVAVAETGFPAYFIRLDPETRMSEVMILPRGDHAVLSADFELGRSPPNFRLPLAARCLVIKNVLC